MPLRPTLLFFVLTTSVFAYDPAALDNGKQLFQKRQLTEAKALFEKLAVAEPNDAELNYWLGLTALNLKDHEAAVRYLEKATAGDANQPRYFHQLGDAYGVSAQKASIFSQMGLAKKCLAAYDRAVALAPDNVEYRKSRYEFYRAAPSIVGGGMDKAVAEIAEIEKRDPVQGAGLRTDIKLKEKKPDEAFAILDDLRKKFPSNQVVLYQYGRLAAMTDLHLDEGENALKEYVAYTPKSGEPPLWAAHWRLAQILEKKGVNAEACSHYEETLRLNPAFDRAREALKRLGPTAANKP
ncbi:MAG: tetratricopeptide repeat protein [Nibricoccus sp.]